MGLYFLSSFLLQFPLEVIVLKLESNDLKIGVREIIVQVAFSTDSGKGPH